MWPSLAEIRLFAGNFAPRGWALCQGQLLAISQYSAVFALLGNSYGGDGRSTFALPDLRGRVPVGPSSGQGLGVAAGLGDTAGVPTLGLNYIICLEGAWPSRD